MKYPFVSIIIVNYNGSHFLPACLDALQDQSYPSNRFEVLVSDNGSTDDSLTLLRSRYPWVHILDNKRNLGYASGNNVAIKLSRGEYIVLLNNDTIPSPTWLENLAKPIENDNQAGMITSRLQLLYDQLILTIQVEPLIPEKNTHELGIQVFGIDSQAPKGIVQYLDGFYGWESDLSGNRFRRTKAVARLGIPVPKGTGDWNIRLCLGAGELSGRKARVRVKVEDQLLAEWMVGVRESSDYDLPMASATRNLGIPLIQNAGTHILKNGSGRDRGTFVRKGEAFYETDGRRYNQIEEVFGGCGAGLLIRRTLLEDIGLLDDDFFMYYEDLDLSWRARLRGWKVLYAPQAIVRHVHCGTSGEWSPLFLYHVDRNRLAMLFKNGPWGQVGLEWGKYSTKVLTDTVRMLLFIVQWRKDRLVLVRRTIIQCRVLWALLKWLPGLWVKRQRIQKNRRVSQSKISTWYVNQD